MGFASRMKATGKLIEFQSEGKPDILQANALSAGLQEHAIEVVPMTLGELQASQAADRVVIEEAKNQERADFGAALARVPPGPVADALAALRKLIQG